MNEAVIRRATLADAELLAELNRDVQQIHADAYPNLFKQLDNTAEIVADFKTRILPDADGFVFIIESEGQAAGIFTQRWSRDLKMLISMPRNTCWLTKFRLSPLTKAKGTDNS